MSLLSIQEGVATIIPRNYSTVNGVLWSINLKNELNLDYYEGIKKKIYFKKYFYIPFLNQKILILVYIAFNQIIGIPKKGYLEKVIDGAKSFKAEKKWINELEYWGN
ncbi:MAG: gamma-glutamylcyclotransferase [Paracoccaceae bacterium]